MNLKKFVKWLLPEELNNSFWLSYFFALVQPLLFVYNLIMTNKKTWLYYLGITGQVCYLEKMLNDRYDKFNRGIYIEDGINVDPVYVYQQVEDNPVYLYVQSENNPVHFFTNTETLDDAADFVVNIPVAVTFNELELKQLVTEFKLPCTNFTINII